jgi:hypothetical protein
VLCLEWQKSSFSSGNINGDCIELAAAPRAISLFRESDAPDVVLIAGPARLAALLGSIKAGQLDRVTGEQGNVEP